MIERPEPRDDLVPKVEETFGLRAVNRRTFLTGALALCGVTHQRLHAGVVGNLRLQTSPFTLGVASGDPTVDGVVIWTRLAPDPLNGGGMPRNPWRSRGMWVFLPAPAAPQVDPPRRRRRLGRWYWYQFRVGNDLSPVGRTRTLPAVGAPVDRLRFAFVSWLEGG